MTVGSETGPWGFFPPIPAEAKLNYNQKRPYLLREKAEVEVKEVSSKDKVTL